MESKPAKHYQVGRESCTPELACLLDAVYTELRTIAASHLRRERPDHTLRTTALVNEAFLRLAHRRSWVVEDRAGFCAAAAQAIRRILTDHARHRRRLRHGGGRVRLELTERNLAAPEPAVDVIELDEGLQRLKAEDPRAARIVELRYFGGMSEQEVANVLGVSRRTVQGEWHWARTWLMRELS